MTSTYMPRPWREKDLRELGYDWADSTEEDEDTALELLGIAVEQTDADTLRETLASLREELPTIDQAARGGTYVYAAAIWIPTLIEKIEDTLADRGPDEDSEDLPYSTANVDPLDTLDAPYWYRLALAGALMPDSDLWERAEDELTLQLANAEPEELEAVRDFTVQHTAALKPLDQTPAVKLALVALDELNGHVEEAIREIREEADNLADMLRRSEVQEARILGDWLKDAPLSELPEAIKEARAYI